MKRLTLALITIFTMCSYAFGAGNSADDYLKRADGIRNPAEDYRMTIKIKTDETDTTFEVFLKGTSKSMIVLKAPAKDRGRNMLMLDRDFYTYVPNLKRSVRLSLAQKFSGQVANGDIARTRWFGDYKASIEKEKQTFDQNQVQLFLEGTKPNLTYQKMRLWVDAKSSRPLHAEFLALDGKTVLKTATYEGYKNIAGAVRPTIIRIVDTNKKESTLTIEEMASTPLEDSFFTESNMETL